MFEVRIIRSDNKYDVIVNNEKILYGIRKDHYFTRKVNYFDHSNPSPIATYEEKRNFFLSTKRSIFFHEPKTQHQIFRVRGCYFFNVDDSSYTLWYGLFKIKGVFLNDIKVGEIEILKTSLLSYEKKIIFFENIKNYLPFIYLFIPVDHNDFN